MAWFLMQAAMQILVVGVGHYKSPSILGLLLCVLCSLVLFSVTKLGAQTKAESG